MGDIRKTETPKDAAFDEKVRRAEAEERRQEDQAHGRDLLGEHPDGVGQTLGGELLRPNPGEDMPPRSRKGR